MSCLNLGVLFIYHSIVTAVNYRIWSFLSGVRFFKDTPTPPSYMHTGTYRRQQTFWLWHTHLALAVLWVLCHSECVQMQQKSQQCHKGELLETVSQDLRQRSDFRKLFIGFQGKDLLTRVCFRFYRSHALEQHFVQSSGPCFALGVVLQRISPYKNQKFNSTEFWKYPNLERSVQPS